MKTNLVPRVLSTLPVPYCSEKTLSQNPITWYPRIWDIEQFFIQLIAPKILGCGKYYNLLSTSNQVILPCLPTLWQITLYPQIWDITRPDNTGVLSQREGTESVDRTLNTRLNENSKLKRFTYIPPGLYSFPNFVRMLQ